MSETTVYKVQKGDCAWNVAKKQLNAQGKKSSSDMIIQEMNRLAEINGCKNYDDLNNKFFTKIGNEIKTEKETPALPDNNPVNKNGSINVPEDSILIGKKTKTDPIAPLSSQDKEINDINKIRGDKNKIIEYNKKHANGNYIVIDKKTCKAIVYDETGKVLDSFAVGLGKQKGDKMNSGLRNGKWAADGAYTTAGQYKLTKGVKNKHNIEAYLNDKTNNLNVYTLDGVQHDEGYKENVSLGIHQVPNYRRGERNHLLKDDKTSNNISNNRMSFGCINLLEEDIERMNKHIESGTSLYILPEENGNKLVLNKMSNGEIAFKVQYKNMADQAAADIAEQKFYSKRPKVSAPVDNPPLVAKNETKNEEFSIWKPSTWFL